jgi:hypothetical protein
MFSVVIGSTILQVGGLVALVIIAAIATAKIKVTLDKRSEKVDEEVEAQAAMAAVAREAEDTAAAASAAAAVRAREEV